MPSIYDKKGNVVGIRCNSIDITEQKMVEKKLQEAKDYLEALIKNFPGYMYIKNVDHQYILCNENFAKVAGVKNSETIKGKTDFDLSWGADEAQEYRKRDEKALEGVEYINFEETQHQANGMIKTVLANKVPFYDHNGEIIGVIGNYFDITERKTLEQELKAAKEKAEALLEERTQFYDAALQVAHDIRSPAAALEMLAKTTNNLPEEQRIILRNATARIHDIANQLLAKYRGDDTETGLKPELISALLLNLLSEKRLQFAQYGLELAVDISREGYFVFSEVNASELKRVLSNLINNAAEAMNFKGKITILLSAEPFEVTLKICDTGPGIAPEILAKLGEQGTSTKKEGSGLGIYHAKQILKSFQGSLHITSKVGKGTEVILNLPRSIAPKWLASEIALSPAQTIYILDDDSAIHSAWDQRLNQVIGPNDNIKIFHFSDPNLALEKIKEDQKRNIFGFNGLLLTDYELIGFDKTGLDVINALQFVPAMLVTSYFEDPQIQAALAEKNAKLLPKNLASDIVIYVDRGFDVVECESVMLEDNEALIGSILFFAEIRQKKIKIYKNSASLFCDLPKIPKSMPFYLDEDIGETQTGVDVGKQLFDQGYKNLYLSTGNTHIRKPDWFIAVVEKTAITKTT